MKRSNNAAFDITEIRIDAAPPELAATGHIAWISLLLNDRLRISGVTARRTLDGEFRLSFPARTSDDGSKHFYIRPINDEARVEIETAIFDALKGLTLSN